MRQRMHGRGLHPKVRSSSFRWWTFDDAEEPSVRELLGGTLTLGQVGTNDTPEILQSPVGTRSRSFNRPGGSTTVLESPSSPSDSTTMQGEWTASTWVRLTDPYVAAATQYIWGLYGIGTNETQAHNWQASLSVRDGEIQVFTESGAGVNAVIPFSTYTAPKDRWLLITLRKTVDGTATYELIVNGELIETNDNGGAGWTNPDGGTAVDVSWKFGGLIDGTTVLGTTAKADLASLHIYNEALPIDEIKADFRRGYLLDSFTHVDMKIEMEDGNGIRRDLTDLDGIDVVDSATVTDSVDNAVQTASLSLLREQINLSIANLRTDTKLNLTDVDNVTSYTALVDINRDVEILAARVPLGIRASGVDWQSVFRGTVDKIDWGSEAVKVECRDLGGILVDTYIEEEVLNPAIIAGVGPEKMPSYGSNVGVPLESIQQEILDDNDNTTANDTVTYPPPLYLKTGSYDPITLVVDGTPNWLLLPYRQKREPVLTALRNLSGQIGWETRYRFSQGATPDLDAWALTLYEPDRARVDHDVILTKREVESLSTLAIDIKNIRNVVRIIYQSSETSAPTTPTISGYTVRDNWTGVDGQGSRLPAFIELENTASVAKYGRRFMEIGEASSSQIDTITEAERMAFAASEDLNEPDLEKSATMDCQFEIELDDVVTFEPIREVYTARQTLAVVGYTHTFGETATTSLELRGKPAVGFKRWLRLESRPGMGRPGVADPRLALTDSERGPLLRVLRELMDQSDFMTGGKYLAIKNQDFQFWSAGTQNPPDSWRITSGTWGTDISEDGTVTRTGGHSVEFANATSGLVSSLIPIESDLDQTPSYSFEIQWRKSVASGREPTVTLDFFQEDRSTAAGSSLVLSPGGGTTRPPTTNSLPENFPSVGATANKWFNSRVDGIQPDTSARFVQITIEGSSGVDTGSMYVDKVAAYRTSHASRAEIDTSTSWGGLGMTPGGTAENIPLSLRTSVPDTFDRGINIAVNESPAPAFGHYFGCKEPGTYDVSASIWWNAPTNVGTNTREIKLQLVLDGQYGTNAQRSSGTIIKEIVQTVTFVGPVGQSTIDLDFTYQLNEGERLTLDYQATTNGTTAGTISWAIGLTTRLSYWSLRLRGID